MTPEDRIRELEAELGAYTKASLPRGWKLASHEGNMRNTVWRLERHIPKDGSYCAILNPGWGTHFRWIAKGPFGTLNGEFRGTLRGAMLHAQECARNGMIPVEVRTFEHHGAQVCVKGSGDWHVVCGGKVVGAGRIAGKPDAAKAKAIEVAAAAVGNKTID